jgi:hypothetical protein
MTKSPQDSRSSGRLHTRAFRMRMLATYSMLKWSLRTTDSAHKEIYFVWTKQLDGSRTSYKCWYLAGQEGPWAYETHCRVQRNEFPMQLHNLTQCLSKNWFGDSLGFHGREDLGRALPRYDTFFSGKRWPSFRMNLDRTCVCVSS